MKVYSLAVLALIGQIQAIKLHREQDEIADGDAADGKQVEDEWDPADDVVDDNGFARNWVQTGSTLRMNTKAYTKREQDEIADGDAADGKQIEDEWDPADDVVDDNGFARNWLMTGSQVNVGRHRPANWAALQAKYDVRFYSDEIANGDTADNKDLHEEEDTKDDVVDFNGSTFRGYGSRLESYQYAHNNI